MSSISVSTGTIGVKDKRKGRTTRKILLLIDAFFTKVYNGFTNYVKIPLIFNQNRLTPVFTVQSEKRSQALPADARQTRQRTTKEQT